MHGIKVFSRWPLTKLLAPAKPMLNQAWWYLGGAGASLAPPNLPGPNMEHVADPDRWAKDNAEWLAAYQRGVDEYACWIDNDADYRVGIPGWFSQYADVVDQDWNLYFACESADGLIPRAALDCLNSYMSHGTDWFGHADRWSLPIETILICRIIDGAYWDFFFRDHWLCQNVSHHLRRSGQAQVSPFSEMVP